MHKIPTLSYSSLGEYMSAETIEYHLGKHHQTYVDKLNAALEAYPELQSKSLDELLGKDMVLPEVVKKAIINNGGGHYNHSIFWQSVSPDGGGQPTGDLLGVILDKYESYEKFVDIFTTTAMNVFGSGWVWLLPNGDIMTTQNQDTPITQGLDTPLLCLDIWEHAYYIDYRNRRADYVKNWWNIVDWKSASEKLATK